MLGCAQGDGGVVATPTVDSTIAEDVGDTLVAIDAHDALEAEVADVSDASDVVDAFDATDAAEAAVDSAPMDSAPIFEADTCDAGLSVCASLCVDLRTDKNNCGKCGTVCSTGCYMGACLPTGTTITFPAKTSTTFRVSDMKTGTLGDGGGRVFRSAGDYVQDTITRSTPITKVTVNFKMSDGTSDLCVVGTLNWNVYINGSVVGSFSWPGGKTPYVGASTPMGPDQTINKTIAFASIAPASGGFSIKFQATNTVCPGGGEWNWYAGGVATVD
jgi:hypothetical protein